MIGPAVWHAAYSMQSPMPKETHIRANPSSASRSSDRILTIGASLSIILAISCHPSPRPIEDVTDRLPDEDEIRIRDEAETRARAYARQPRDIPEDSLAGTVPRPSPTMEGDIAVYAVVPLSGGALPNLNPLPEVSCMDRGLIEADVDRLQCSTERPCRGLICAGAGGCHGGAHPAGLALCGPGTCPDGQICVVDPTPGSCNFMQTRCTADCRSQGCSESEVCGSDGLCRRPDCRWEGERCGPNTSCQDDGRWGYCLLRPCQRDVECDCGTCLGTCRNGPGRCEQARP
jgi:hypothetical protein